MSMVVPLGKVIKIIEFYKLGGYCMICRRHFTRIGFSTKSSKWIIDLP